MMIFTEKLTHPASIQMMQINRKKYIPNNETEEKLLAEMLRAFYFLKGE